MADNERPTLGQARLNGPGSQHALSHDGYRALPAISKAFQIPPPGISRYSPTFPVLPLRCGPNKAEAYETDSRVWIIDTAIGRSAFLICRT